MQQQNLSAKQKKALAALTFESSTMDLLKRIELRMEMLTQELERLPEEKVKIAQRVSFYPLIKITFYESALYNLRMIHGKNPFYTQSIMIT